MFELVEQQPSHLACPDVLNLSLGESEAAGPPTQGTACSALGCGLCAASSLPSLLPPHPVPLLLTFKTCMNPRCRHLVICVCDVEPGTLLSIPLVLPPPHVVTGPCAQRSGLAPHGSPGSV